MTSTRGGKKQCFFDEAKSKANHYSNINVQAVAAET